MQLDPASQTSVALLKILLAENDLRPSIVLDSTVNDDAGVARLLIGDQAIRFRANQVAKFRYWDLAGAWRKMTSLPFVFALWLIRPEVKKAGAIAEVLRGVRDKNLDHISQLAHSQASVPPEFCEEYYERYLFFGLGEAEKAGLREFHRRCLAIEIDVSSRLTLEFV